MQKLFGDSLKTITRDPGIYYLKLGKYNYVGSSVGLKERILAHRNDMLGNKHHNPWIQRIYNKYGEEVCYFSILEVLNTTNLSDIRERELYWINLLGPTLNNELDPATQQNCASTSKKVYQFDFNGKFLKEY